MKMTTKTKREPRGDASRWVAFQNSIRLSNATGLLTRALRWWTTRQGQRAAGRLLHVEETVSLGQKRFAAVLRVQNERYLVGGGANEVVLLASLGQQAEPQVHLAVTEAAANEAEPGFQEILRQASAPKKTGSAKTATGRTRSGTKQCA